MEHDASLVDKLSELPTERFDGFAFRATRRGLEPTRATVTGGRWALRGESAVLYTSLTKEGAIAEMAFHWGQSNPRPSVPLLVHRLRVVVDPVLRIQENDLQELGIDPGRYREMNYVGTQLMGEAVAYLAFGALIVPCARWDCDNLVLFEANFSTQTVVEVVDSHEVDWQRWGVDNGILED